MLTPSRPIVSIAGTRRALIGLTSLASLCLLVPAVAAQPLGAEFRVNTSTGGRQYRPAVDADGAGNFVVVWQTNTLGVFAQRYDSGGAPQGPPFVVAASNA